jgi:serine protease DegQ
LRSKRRIRPQRAVANAGQAAPPEKVTRRAGECEAFGHYNGMTMSLRSLWLIFAQTATVALGVLFVIATLRPEWLPIRDGAPARVAFREAPRAPDDGITPPAASAASYSVAVRRALPSVVHIFTSRELKSPRNPFFDDPVFRQFFGDALESAPRRATGLGSGVIVSPAGYVITNNHVVEGMDEIDVATNDGQKFKARVVGTDPETDLAVIKLDGQNLPAITLGNLGSVQVGDVVLAIGNPFGVGQTVTMGIVSALGRSGLGITTYENLVQTDAAINRGNSGGALVNASGELIGINTAILSPSGGSLGIGFAVPVSTAREVLEQIVATGSVTRGFVGIEARELTPELVDSLKLSSAAGVQIAGLVPNGPAARAGAKVGDVLLAIDGKPISNPHSMLETVAKLRPGKAVVMQLRRGSRDVDVRVTVSTRPKPAAPR